MYFLLKLEIFQPAMLVYHRIKVFWKCLPPHGTDSQHFTAWADDTSLQRRSGMIFYHCNTSVSKICLRWLEKLLKKNIPQMVVVYWWFTMVESVKKHRLNKHKVSSIDLGGTITILGSTLSIYGIGTGHLRKWNSCLNLCSRCYHFRKKRNTSHGMSGEFPQQFIGKNTKKTSHHFPKSGWKWKNLWNHWNHHPSDFFGKEVFLIMKPIFKSSESGWQKHMNSPSEASRVMISMDGIIPFPIGSMGLVYLPTCTIKINQM